MHSDLRNFATQYLSIVFGVLMAVSFFAFVAIPYNLGSHPGEEPVAQAATVVAVAAPNS